MIAELLAEITVSSLVDATKPVITLSDCDSVEVALSTLSHNAIQSAPVVDSDTGAYKGFFSSLDVVRYAVQLYSEGQGDGGDAPAWTAFAEDVKTLAHRGVRFGIKPIKNIMGEMSEPFIEISEHGTLAQLLDVLVSRKVHRVGVKNDAGSLVAIATQSMVVEAVAKHMDSIDLKAESVEKLDLGTSEVISMSYQAQAITAFYLMFFNKVPAVAITSSEELVANISASDINGLRAESFDQLLDPILTFLARRSYPGRGSNTTSLKVKPVVSCTRSSSFETVLLKLTAYRLHRLWVVDKDDRPVGVITLSDVLTLLHAFAGV